MSDPEIIEWLQEVVVPIAGSQTKLAEMVQAELRRQFDKSKINKILKGRREIEAVELRAIEKVFKSRAPRDGKSDLLVPLISWVSAGNLLTPDGSESIVDAPRVSGPELDPAGDWVALKVVGDSMDRISPPDSIIFVNRRDVRLVPNACYVVVDEDGSATYKRYRDGKFSPVSTNKQHRAMKPAAGQAIGILGRVRKSVLAM